LKREVLGARFPVHVVLRLDKGLPTLRTKHPFKVLRRAFAAGCDQFGFRLNHYSVLGDHLHFIVEARDREALSRGLQGLSIRIAKGLNKLWGRKGRVFADRYFDRILRTPLEVKNALRYVLRNSSHHGAHADARPDIFSSGMFFDGWRDYRLEDFVVSEPPPLALARTWLQRVGWRLHGLIATTAAR
jgi:REP element-mobilizing transposase RayT